MADRDGFDTSPYRAELVSKAQSGDGPDRTSMMSMPLARRRFDCTPGDRDAVTLRLVVALARVLAPR